MSDPTGPSDDAAGPSGAADDQGPVGSVGEEAAKLLGALSDWARTQGTDYAASGSGAAAAFAHAFQDVNEHISTDTTECRYCPVCQVIHAVRQTSPEVRAHLGQAASSLMHAAGELLATRTGRPDPASSPVQKIDLDAEGEWPEEGPGATPRSPREDPWD